MTKMTSKTRLTFGKRMQLAEQIKQLADDNNVLEYDDSEALRSTLAHAIGLDSTQIGITTIRSTAKEIGVTAKYKGQQGIALVNAKMTELEARITRIEMFLRAAYGDDKYEQGKPLRTGEPDKPHVGAPLKQKYGSK